MQGNGKNDMEELNGGGGGEISAEADFNEVIGGEVSAEADFSVEAIDFPPPPKSDLGTGRKKRTKFTVAFNLVLIVFIALLLALIAFMNIFILCPVSQSSMYPTIYNGQRVLLVKAKSIKSGDVFVFESVDLSTGGNKNLIKRCVAVGGERLLFVSVKKQFGKEIVYLYKDSGEGFYLMDESEYLSEPMDYIDTYTSDFCKVYRAEADEEVHPDALSDYYIEVPANTFYAMGDNRNESEDSRKLGFIKKGKVIGRMTTKLRQGSVAEKLLKFLYRDNG